VGGHLDSGEDFLEGAYRELAEETGVQLDEGLELFGQFTVHHEHTDSDDEFQLFVMRTDLTDDEIECHEGRQIVFVAPGRVKELDLTAAARIALGEFLRSETYSRLTA
jgi:8-oxo-dGTP pyrophosphatase MutT (NUDIX family)